MFASFLSSLGCGGQAPGQDAPGFCTSAPCTSDSPEGADRSATLKECAALAARKGKPDPAQQYALLCKFYGVKQPASKM